MMEVTNPTGLKRKKAHNEINRLERALIKGLNSPMVGPLTDEDIEAMLAK